MAESVHEKLKRVRPPRVNISYEVETGGAIEMKELPFVMGVLGDFTGQPTEPLEKLKDRKFTEVTLDNFDEVLASMKPHLAFSVDNTLSEEGGKIGVNLTFESLDDFSPDQVAKQVKPLRELLELRQKLADLMLRDDKFSDSCEDKLLSFFVFFQVSPNLFIILPYAFIDSRDDSSMNFCPP